MGKKWSFWALKKFCVNGIKVGGLGFYPVTHSRAPKAQGSDLPPPASQSQFKLCGAFHRWKPRLHRSGTRV